ncbi:hypothetical protein KL867_11965 [Ruegeria litorea]|uniref:Capsule polysaccharide biosynthesis protein n=1 Tax=Falsiruegeria litorea TaxID=1280831 RepID=A0ABS5WRM3_9RHOB|nr:hypothetical protein [Falsiruegeria litorea]MBT3141774.1 hypothetical protein [Falsiruegeria litorea]
MIRKRLYRLKTVLLRKLQYGGPLRLSKLLIRYKQYKLAGYVLYLPGRYNKNCLRTLKLKKAAYEGQGDFARASEYQARRLRLLMAEPIKDKNYDALLALMAEMERTTRAAPFKAGQLIARQMVSDPGRRRVLGAALRTQKNFKDSAYLIHIITLCRAMKGAYRPAARMAVKELANPHDAPELLQARRTKILQGSWRVVDLIARESMDWANESGDYDSFLTEATNKKKPAKGVDETTEEAVAAKEKEALSRMQSFKELTLQGRLRDKYLKICDEEFADATTLRAKIKAAQDMVRASVRHVPDYSSSYELARTRLTGMNAELEALFDDTTPRTVAQNTEMVLGLCDYLLLARRLGMEAEKTKILQRMEALSEQPDMLAVLWPVPAMIARDVSQAQLAGRIMARLEVGKPKINRDMQNYFRWAMITREYEKANAFYKALPKNLLRRSGLLYYANILQRQGQFKEALDLVRDVYGQLLSNPSTVNAYSSHSLIKRVGELRFLIETAKHFQSVPQPQNPKGVILIAPRNIDQLRRNPLMVLVEFKRKGWAVVPIVEGFLPKELTGIEEIDVMNGAINPNICLSDDATEAMPEIEDFVFEPENATLRWGPIDLGHSLWEDAAINRRRYTIHWQCPELQNYLGGLADWTRAEGRVLQYARQKNAELNLPTGCISLFSYRLPDSLLRFFCEEHGDPEQFFCLQAANGYQNYFTNFSTNVSQRFVLRNVTKHPEVRSGSFPIPEYFENYYERRKPHISEIMERFIGVTKVKRSTEGTSGRPPEAEALDARIRAWQAKGGKIACAFGKVVCDSGVPYDGGPAHQSMKDWLNHCIRAVQGSNTLLLIKPHPHELNNQIATFPTEYFRELIEEPLGENAIFMGHRWFDMHDMQDRMDMGLVYNGTTAIELGIMGIPCVLASHFAPIDYPIGHAAPKDRADFEAYVRFEKPLQVATDLRERAAVWLDYMANEEFTQAYRFHTRPVTNKVLYPPYWFSDDVQKHVEAPDAAVVELAGRALGERFEPGFPVVQKVESKPHIHIPGAAAPSPLETETASRGSDTTILAKTHIRH